LCGRIRTSFKRPHISFLASPSCRSFGVLLSWVPLPVPLPVPVPAKGRESVSGAATAHTQRFTATRHGWPTREPNMATASQRAIAATGACWASPIMVLSASGSAMSNQKRNSTTWRKIMQGGMELCCTIRQMQPLHESFCRARR